MKNQLKRLAMATGLSTLMGGALLLGSWDVNGHAEVPFDFQVNNRTMPAGHYEITEASTISSAYDSNVLVIRNMNTGASVIALAPSSKYNNRGQGKLVFKEFGNRYFLTEVAFQGESIGHGLTQSHVERELSRNGSMGQGVLASIHMNQ